MEPWVVAHRGSSFDAAEHTLGAYKAAIADGADGLECDVRLTADGHLVLVHDRTLRKAGHEGVISTMTLAELDGIDVASWKNPWADLDDEAPDQDLEDGTVLTLRKLLEVVQAQDRRIDVAIETKHPTRYGGLVEKRLAELLGEFGWTHADSPVRVMSFSYTALQRFNRLAPDVRLVQLLEHAHYWPMLRRVIGSDWIVGPGIGEMRDHPGLRARLQDTGREVHVWVVNTEEDLRLCQESGVRAVITDRPLYIRRLLGR